jgi:nitrite reductase/ring-hydroxylating ferredoxin subunit
MAELKVGKESDLLEGTGRQVVTVDDREHGVFLVDGELYAFESRCPHQGGPVCRGSVIPRIETVLAADGSVVEERYVDSTANLVCPWHGFEFDIKTGRCVADPRFRLRSYPVSVREGEVYVEL